MIAVYVHENGSTREVDRVEPAWLDPSSPVKLWVDLPAPSDSDFALLNDIFHFHPLSIEDARSALQYPKVEQYPQYLYLVLHGILHALGYDHETDQGEMNALELKVRAGVGLG